MQIDIVSQSWTHEGTGFRVEVHHWYRPATQLAKDTLPNELTTCVNANKWNVYLYVYPKHRLYGKLLNEHFDCSGIDFPFHGGVSYHNWICSSTGDVIYKKIGCDYSHLYDDCFSEYAIQEDAHEVFQDADDLINFVNNYK